MGSGIAEVAARAGLAAVIREPTEEYLTGARERVERSTASAVARSKLSEDERDRLLERISYVTDFDGLATCELVVEAVPEKLDLKREVFTALDRVCDPATVLASNTSSIPIAELAGVTDRPDRVLGLHFFSPVPVMQLLELVRALRTSDETVEVGKALGEVLGKQVIQTKDRAGFIVNMLLIPYLVAAIRMYEEGFATRDDIDAGMRLGCAHPMGPLQLADFIGLDVTYEVCNSLFDEFKDSAYAPPPLLKRMLAAGMLGRKSQQGFYSYR
ncbi:MAG: 3-hydroxybutyryl-CoA dehydrogenase [Chloroflexota bacterium]|jgi:3-hydroxybutyryl-CoA dehydrogenase|nr:3-hydroxybutyryl-CoA dehydrogenase [Chloroflexota bacterium]